MAPHQGDIRCCKKNGGDAEIFIKIEYFLKLYYDNKVRYAYEK